MLGGGLRVMLKALVLPVNCLGCGTEGDWLCQECRRQLPLRRAERCALCGKAATEGICERCGAQTKLDGVIAPFAYAEPMIRALIQAVKYRGYTDALTFLMREYRRAFTGLLPPGAWCLSPIPLARVRFRERGFNQAQVLAQTLCEPGLPVRMLLQRRRETSPQVELSKQQRQHNVRGCFVLGASQGLVPPAVILVDDVITTGATLGEAAKVLRRAGAGKIWALTVAHG